MAAVTVAGAAVASGAMLTVGPAGPARAAVVAPVVAAPAPSATKAGALPSVSAVSPGAGSTAGGASVTISGAGFTRVSKVLFGTKTARNVRVVSSRKLIAVAPQHGVGVVDVRVVARAGKSTERATDRFTYLTRPQAPFVESVAGTGLGVVVDWAPPDPADKVQGFSVTAIPAAGSSASCPAITAMAGSSDTQAVVGKLCAGVVYTAMVRARNQAAYSAASNLSAPVVPLTAQPPGSPLITSVTPRNGSLNLTWAAPADDGGSAVRGYVLTANGGGQTVTVKARAAATAGVITGLVNGTSYGVSLTAFNPIGTSPAATAAGTPQSAGPPSPPVGLTVVPDGKGHLVASWQPPLDNGGGAVTGYRISYRQATLDASTGQWTPVAGAKVYTLKAGSGARRQTAATFGTTNAFYLFTATAVNSAGAGAAATQQVAVTPVLRQASRVIVLSAATVGALSGVTASALTWSDPAPAQASRLAVGQTIVAASGGLLPGGLLREVVAVSSRNGTLTVRTVQGELGDAFTAMGVDATVNPFSSAAGSGQASSGISSGTPMRPAFTPTMAGVRVLPAAPAATIGTTQSIKLSVDVKVGAVKVDVEVSIAASVNFSLGVHTGFAGVPSGVTVSATATVKADVAGTVDVTGDWSTQIGEIDSPPVDIQVGPVPVVVEPKIPLFLTASGSAGVGIDVSDTIGGSVFWSSADPTQLAIKNLSTSPLTNGYVIPAVTATGDVSVGLQVQPQVDIYDVAGPNVEGDLDLDASINFNPPAGTPFLTLGPQLALKAGVDLELFTEHASLEETIGSYQFAAFSIEDPPNASYTISPASPLVSPGGTLALTASRSDGASDPVSWALLGGTTSDSISSGGVLQAGSPVGRTLVVTASDPTGAAGETTVTVGVPFDPPASVSAAQDGVGSGAISWTAPASSGGSAVASYKVITQPSTGTHTLSGTATSLQLSSLTQGSYAVYIYAINKAGSVSAPGTATLAMAAITGGVAATTATEAPGLARLNGGGDAQVTAISCPFAGNCSAGGYYTDKDGNNQAFVVSEVGGKWDTAIQVAGTGSRASSAGVQARAEINAMSCGSPGNCVAGGISYPQNLSSSVAQAFVVSEVNGTWGSATAIPGMGSLSDGNAYNEVTAVSCASPGNCSAGGEYASGRGWQGFVVSEVNGTWGRAIEVPGLGALNVDDGPDVTSMSCPRAGDCSAGGSYYDKHANQQAFVVSEVSGTWRKAIEVPGTASLQAGGSASASSVSCASSGNCAAVGTYSGNTQDGSFVDNEVSGTWRGILTYPGISQDSVSCTSAGNCTAVGTAAAGDPSVVSEHNGSWGAGVSIPGLTALGAEAAVAQSVSCWSAGNCIAGGEYETAQFLWQAFTVVETNGTWATPMEVPGSAALNLGQNADASEVSCAPGGSCGAGGFYIDGSGATQAFVINQS